MSYILLRSSSQLISQLLKSESRRSDSVTSVHDPHLPIIGLLIGRSRLNTKFFIDQNHPGTTQTLGWFLMWLVGMAKVTTQTTRGAALPRFLQRKPFFLRSRAGVSPPGDPRGSRKLSKNILIMNHIKSDSPQSKMAATNI